MGFINTEVFVLYETNEKDIFAKIRVMLNSELLITNHEFFGSGENEIEFEASLHLDRENTEKFFQILDKPKSKETLLNQFSSLTAIQDIKELCDKHNISYTCNLI